MNVVLVLAGGTGARLGAEIPKQYIDVKGKPIIAYCMERLGKMAFLDGMWVVAEEQWRPLISRYAGKFLKGFSLPGENRQLSIWSGLQDIAKFASPEDIVVVHDAARPLVTERLIKDCIDACETHDGALPVLPMKDTVYIGENGQITSLLDRNKVFAGQAPEAFRFGRYFAANKALSPEKIRMINGSTEPAVMAGMKIALVTGDENNFKITTKPDLLRFQELIEKGVD